MNCITVEQLLRDARKRLGFVQTTCQYGSENKIGRTGAQRCMENKTFYDNLHPETILILAPSHIDTLNETPASTREKIFQTISLAGIPCIIISETRFLPEFIVQLSNVYRIPVLTSLYDGYLLESRLFRFLREKIDNVVMVHGALVNVNGVGVLITGESGTGKTMCAMRLAAEGHAWVADDVIEIMKKKGGVLYGRSHEAVKNYLEIKNLGIFNAKDLFGEASVREETVVNIVVKFGISNDHGNMPANDAFDEAYDILGVKLPCMGLPASSDWREPAGRIDIATRNFSSGGRVV